MLKLEVRGNYAYIDSYVNVTDRDSRIINHPTQGKFIERIVPNAFEKALQRAENINLVLNHDKSKVLASTKKGDLTLWEDQIGLRCIAKVKDPQLIQMVRNKELSGFSFGFCPIKQRWEEIRVRKDGAKRRFVEDMELTEISILDKSQNPAYSCAKFEKRATPFDLDKYLLEKYIEISKIKRGY